MAALAPYRGKLALVTGAGDGIGKMLARGFAEAGLCVCVQDIREEAAATAAAEIGEAAFPLVFDVSDRGAVTRAAAELFQCHVERVCLAALLAVGLSWAHIWRRLTGQYAVDEIDD
jgi:NAD(P)-dependent dehydrogenase (short-subunit alcohol dehydrogenase family)